MDEFWRLVVLSLSMFVGCYLAGSIPLILTLSEGVLRKVTTFGAGLLIGTALIVIIPEGMENLFGNALSTYHHHTHNMDPSLLKMDDIAQKVEQQLPDPNNPPGQQPLPDVPQVEQQDGKMDQEGKEKEENIPQNKGQDDLEGMEDEKPVHEYTTDQLQFFMGLSLVTGFVFMMLIDQCGGGHSHTHISVDGELGRHRRKNMTATIGLVVHAAADGLALGAAAGLSKADVEFIIFIAIMLHKAPAAFGFTSFLIHEGFDRVTAKRHLLVFALAAPIAAFAAYFGLIKVLYTIQLPFTGITMLFSAGTFLYVATVHVLSELTQPSSSSPSDLSGGNGHRSKLSRQELVLISAGALLPLVFNIFHSHGH